MSVNCSAHYEPRIKITTVLASMFIFGGGIGTALSKEHFVPSSTSSIDCLAYGGGVSPGDTITLASGERGPLTISNCVGTQTAPIIVRNDVRGNSPTTIRNSSGDRSSFVFHVRDVKHFVIDGSAGWSGMRSGAYCGAPDGTSGCGIKITLNEAGTDPIAFLRVSGLSTDFTIRGVEIDGKYRGGFDKAVAAGIGISVRDQAVTVDEHPTFWRENVLIEGNYIHHTFGEGMYLGPNYRSELEVPSRNWEVRHNFTHDTGRQGIQLKRATSGFNWIHHNVVVRSGVWEGETIAGEKHGISCFESTCVMSHNFVVDSGEAGLSFRLFRTPAAEGVKVFQAFNNVVINAGLRPMTPGHGIVAGSSDSAPDVEASIFNNTVVNSAEDGIRVGSAVSGSEIRDNISVGSGGTDIVARDGVAVLNNQTGRVSSQKFRDVGRLDFRLTEESLARHGGSRGGFPYDDFDGVSRRDLDPISQGAFESAGINPNPPQINRVQ